MEQLSVTLLNVAIVWGIAVAIPGPNFFATIQTAVSRNRRMALRTVMGIAAGTLIWGISGYFGVALLFEAAPWLYKSLKVLGGLYLIYLGTKLLLSRTRTDPTDSHRAAAGIGPFKNGMMTSLSNPKTAVFVSSLFASTLPADVSLQVGFMAVAIMTVLSVLWYAAVAAIFSWHLFQRAGCRSRQYLEGFAGAVFIAFGLHVIWDDAQAPGR